MVYLLLTCEGPEEQDSFTALDLRVKPASQRKDELDITSIVKPTTTPHKDRVVEPTAII
jgi:hypothetical protein